MCIREAAAIPLIIAGSDVPTDSVVNTPVSLVDCYPTILEAMGVEPTSQAADLPGESLWSIAKQPDRERTIFSEYHAAGSRSGIYMLCDGYYKYIEYLYEPAQLFDLDTDPEERINLAALPNYTCPEKFRTTSQRAEMGQNFSGELYQGIRRDFERKLQDILEPAVIDALAKADQAAKVAAFDGEEAVLARGLSNSAIPGEAPAFQAVR